MLTEKIKEQLHGEADYDVHALLREAFTELTAGNRDRRNRQKAVHDWCIVAFGDDHAKSVEQRGIRLAEEAIEAAQACGCDPAMVHRLVDHVYSKPVGDLAQELGGVGVTMLALAQAAGLDADAVELAEVERVLSKPLDYFRARNDAKNAAGFDVLTPSSPAKEVFAMLYQDKERLILGAPHKSRECAEDGVSPFEGATVVGVVSGTVDVLPEPMLGMKFALQRAAAKEENHV